MESNCKTLFLYQIVVSISVGVFLSSCESPFLERHQARCLAYGFKEGSDEMEKCKNDLLKKEKQELHRQSYDSAQSRAQQHLDSAQIKWKKQKKHKDYNKLN